MALTKPTYRKRFAERRPNNVYIIRDKKREKYLKRMLGRIGWADRPEDASFYTSSDDVHKVLNDMVSNVHPQQVWADYMEELEIEYDDLQWEHIARFFDVIEIEIKAKKVKTHPIGEDW